MVCGGPPQPCMPLQTLCAFPGGMEQRERAGGGGNLSLSLWNSSKLLLGKQDEGRKWGPERRFVGESVRPVA